MFLVQHKETGAVECVYGINGTLFIFWDEQHECWRYGNMDDYKPLEAQR